MLKNKSYSRLCLSFLTAHKDNLHIHFLGLGTRHTFTADELQPKIESGSLIVLPTPLAFGENKGMYADNKMTIFIADKQDPSRDIPIPKAQSVNIAERWLQKSVPA